MKRAGLLCAVIMMAGCSTGPSHIGNPLTLPGRAITHGISELGYKARRAKVKDFAARNRAQMQTDITAGGGSVLSAAMDLACVEGGKRADLITELRRDPALYTGDDIEPLVVALMVHGE